MSNKDFEFITISRFMVNTLHLKGNQLFVYAIIYGFSKDGKGKFNGSLQYLCDWTRSTKKGVSNSLKALQQKGYIKKKELFYNGVKYCEYYATNSNTMELSSQKYDTNYNGVCNLVPKGIELSTPNSIRDIIKDNINDNIDTTELENKFNQFWEVYPRKNGKATARTAFFKIAPDNDLFSDMIDSIQQWSKSDDWKKNNGQYIPNPAKWLDEERWEDQAPAQPYRCDPSFGLDLSNIEFDFEELESRYQRK